MIEYLVFAGVVVACGFASYCIGMRRMYKLSKNEFAEEMINTAVLAQQSALYSISMQKGEPFCYTLVDDLYIKVTKGHIEEVSADQYREDMELLKVD